MGSYRASVGHRPILRVEKDSLGFAGQDIGFTIAAVGNIWPTQGAISYTPIVRNGRGSGMNTPGGSGRTLNVVHTVGTQVTASRILRVTSLLTTSTGTGDSGSLAYCINRHNSLGGPSTIVFDTSGTLNLAGAALPTVTAALLTIAAWTAPAPGFQLRGRILIKASDVYVGHLCARYGSTVLPSDTFEMSGGNTAAGEIRRLVMDHCLAMWGNDETFSLVNYERELTFSNCIIAEGSGVQGGLGHQLNSLCPSGTDQIMFYGCLLHTGYARNPRILGANNAIVNSVVYNWTNRCVDWARINEVVPITTPQYLSLVGNSFVDGPANTGVLPVTSAQAITQGGGIYFSDNRWIKAATTVTTKASMVAVDNSIATEVTPTYWPTGLIADTSANAYSTIVSKAGPCPARRDSVITRLFTQLAARTHSPKLNADPATVGAPKMTGSTELIEADWPTFATNTGAFPATPPSGGNWNDIVTGNYTRLEAYIHTLEDAIL